MIAWRAALVIALVPAVAWGQRDAPRDVGWELRVADRIEVAQGQAAPLAIAVAVDRGLTVSKDTAVILDLDPEPGATVKKKRLGRGDAVDPEADAPRFAVGVHGDAPGEHVLRLRLQFWLCGHSSCRPIEVRRTTTIVVRDAIDSPH